MKKVRMMWVALALVIVAVGVLSIPVSRRVAEDPGSRARARTRVNVSSDSGPRPGVPLDVLFIHHSVGGRWLAAPGEEDGSGAILKTHPSGGGLRALLEAEGYRVHQASFGSRIGERTDLFDWLPKFRDQMDEILRTDAQDITYADGRRNQIVMFKSCFPNNAFRGEGSAPGDPAGPELTVWNARATFSALLEEFRKRPEVLFVCVTAPPLAPGRPSDPLWRYLARTAKQLVVDAPYDRAESGPLARRFNNWLVDSEGWLAAYPLKNVVVFDYYDTLTDHGESNLSRYPTWGGEDSHPSREGNDKAAREFIPFLNGAVQRFGLAGAAQGDDAGPR